MHGPGVGVPGLLGSPRAATVAADPRVAVCPVKDTLEVRTAGRSLSAHLVVGLVTAVFLGVTGLAMATGHWKNMVSRDEYLRRFQHLDSPLYQHARGQVPAYGPED